MSSGLSGWIDGRRWEACSGIQSRAASGQSTTLSLSTSRSKDAEETKNGKPEPTAEERQASEAEASQLARELDDEIASGKCSDRHFSTLEHLMHRVADVLAKARSGSVFDVLSQKILPVSTGGTPVKLTTGAGGKLHLLVAGVAPITIELRDEQGNLHREKSSQGWLIHDMHPAYETRYLERYARRQGIADLPEPPVASRMLQANANDALAIKAVGRGCTLFMLIREY